MENADVWHIQWREYESPDPEISTVSMAGVQAWVQTAEQLIERSYGCGRSGLQRAAEMAVYLAMGFVREFAHMPRDVQADRRAALVDACVTFADAGVDRMLAPTVKLTRAEWRRA